MLLYFCLLLISGVCVEACVELIVKSVFFSWFRDFLAARKNVVYQFFYNAYSCPYCASVHLAFLISSFIFILYTPYLTGIVLLDFVLFVFVSHRVSNYIHNISDVVEKKNGKMSKDLRGDL